MSTANPLTNTQLAGTTPLAPATHTRLGRVFVDSAIMTRRGFAHWRRNPWGLVIGLLFPVMLMVMFGYFLGGGMEVAGGGDYIEFLVPGMFALTMAFGLEATMVALTQDINRGVLDRFRSMPIAPSAVLAGRSLVEILESVVSLLVMIGAGLLIGWRWHGTLAAALGAVGLLVLLRFAMLWVGIYLALVAGKPELVQAVQMLVWPIVFLSNAFVSPATMPAWLGAIAEWNPMSATAGAVRELFENPGWTDGTSWIADNSMLMAVVWPLALLLIFAPLAVRRFRALSR